MTGASREPLSWLVLERYALDELGPDERAAVEVRLGESADDRVALARIRSEQVQLPPLPVRGAARGPRRGLWASGALALAASLLIARVSLQGAGEQRDAVTKGGELTLALVSELHGGAPHTFTPGERFKVRVTCTAEQAGELAVVVFQGGERFRPLLGEGVRCGENLGLWPRAFTLDGDVPAEVCVAGESALGSARSAAEVGAHGACVRLERAR
jgi:hypothetical protein